MRPRIGINCDVKARRRPRGDGRLLTLNPDFVRCVSEAGGLPVLLPPLSIERSLDRAGLGMLLDLLDGLVLTGGDDMHPRAYGQDLNPHTQLQDPDRDGSDQVLARESLRRGLPILAICGGMQLVNVALGGSLHQHLPDLKQSLHPELLPIHHAQESAPGERHDVELAPGSRLVELLGPELLRTNSRHPQGIDQLGRGLAVSARAADGVIEALEGGPGPFLICVQWHPEEHLGDLRQMRLFQGLIRAAEDRTEPSGNR